MFEHSPKLQKIYTRLLEIPASFLHETLHLTPNMVSVLAFALSMTGIVLIAFKQIDWGILVTFISYLFDALDGTIARKYNLQTKLGLHLEMIFDGLHELLLYPALAYAGVCRLALEQVPDNST